MLKTLTEPRSGQVTVDPLGPCNGQVIQRITNKVISLKENTLLIFLKGESGCYENEDNLSGNKTAPCLVSDCRVRLSGTSVRPVLRSCQTLTAFFLEPGAHFHPVFHPSSPRGFGPLR